MEFLRLFDVEEPASSDALAEATDQQLTDLAKWAWTHRVVYRLWTLLHADQQRRFGESLFTRDGHHLEDHRLSVHALMAELPQLTERAGVDALLFKGSVVQAYYPGYFPRHCRDTDLLVADDAALGKLHAVLDGHGFTTIVGTPIVWRGGTILKLRHPARGLMVEIHSGGFPVSHFTGLGFAELASEATSFRDSKRLHTVSLQHCYLLLLSEMFMRLLEHWVMLRDLHDLAVLTSALRRASAESQAQGAADKFGLSPIRAALEQGGPALLQPWQPSLKGHLSDARLFVSHALVRGIAELGPVWGSLGFANHALKLVGRQSRTAYHMSDRIGRALGCRRDHRYLGSVMFLETVGVRRSESVEWHRHGKLPYLTTPFGTYLPDTGAAACPKQLATLRRIHGGEARSS